LITATNKNLAELVNEGKFREDLYYRLNVVPINLPPLRERKEDIPPLIQHFTDKYNRKYNSYKKFSEDLINQMVGMAWKGNIRELENIVERSIVTTAGNHINWEKVQIPGIEKTIPSGVRLKELLAQHEQEILLHAQEQYQTTRRIASALGISQASAARKLKNIKENNSD
ncbi:MAG: sigma 54-interacting transcriptional regulator, partial [Desulfuromusa sp.]|nr:sigma 54-interacting transcriptional regulator [Desulfuromusa sp.]